MPSVILHVQNEDPVLGEIDQLPGLSDTLLLVKNPRKRDGKDLHYLDLDVTVVIWPIARLNFIEILPGKEDQEIITFVRE